MGKKNNDSTDNYIPFQVRKNRVIPGVILVFLGVIFLLNNYGYLMFDIGKLWPIFLIIPGVLMLSKSSD